MNYPYLPYSLVHKYEKLADKYGISKSARGLEQPKTSDEGFVRVYERVKKPEKLKGLPIKKSVKNGIDWWKARENRVKAKLGQMKKMGIPLYENGIPTKMHTILIMWAYSPEPEVIKKIKI